MQKKLQQLIELLSGVNVIGTTDKTVTDITADSRIVQHRFPRCTAGKPVHCVKGRPCGRAQIP